METCKLELYQDQRIKREIKEVRLNYINKLNFNKLYSDLYTCYSFV